MIEPLDNNLVAPDSIPQRAKTDSDAVYPSIDSQSRRVEERLSRHDSFADGVRREVKYSDMVRINALVAIPYTLSFASIVAILALPPGTDPASALESRAAMIALTVPAVFPWIFSFFKLQSELWDYKMSFAAFIGIYLLFICPAIDISSSLLSKDVPIAVILAATVLLSQLYLFSIARSFIKKSLPLIPALVVILLICCAAIL